jgi:hypothetical protein
MLPVAKMPPPLSCRLQHISIPNNKSKIVSPQFLVSSPLNDQFALPPNNSTPDRAWSSLDKTQYPSCMFLSLSRFPSWSWAPARNWDIVHWPWGTTRWRRTGHADAAWGEPGKAEAGRGGLAMRQYRHRARHTQHVLSMDALLSSR